MGQMSIEQVLELFKDLTETIEQNTQNHINFCLFCRMGGLQALFVIIVVHDNDQVRKAACSLFSLISANNLKVQEFAARMGAINFTAQLEREKTP